MFSHEGSCSGLYAHTSVVFSSEYPSKIAQKTRAYYTRSTITLLQLLTFFTDHQLRWIRLLAVGDFFYRGLLQL